MSITVLTAARSLAFASAFFSASDLGKILSTVA